MSNQFYVSIGQNNLRYFEKGLGNITSFKAPKTLGEAYSLALAFDGCFRNCRLSESPGANWGHICYKVNSDFSLTEYSCNADSSDCHTFS